MAVAFFSLILISSRLHSVCKEVKFLQYIQSEWLPTRNLSSLSSLNNFITSPPTSQMPKNQVIQLENLRQDLDVFIMELWSTRNALILGLVFVVAYIVSWIWITYQLQGSFGLSLKRVLLLVVFAAVDIASSTGFIMVRLIMVSSLIINPLSDSGIFPLKPLLVTS